MEGQAGRGSLHRHRVSLEVPFRPRRELTESPHSSIKLKSANGKDRSIAHFYRHVEIFPYFNPAVLLAPALKPLVANAAKGLFMGGSGKVNLSAKMYRANWVAGQRCYVEISVENESSKKVSSPWHLALRAELTISRL
jgi:hypothetical protein